MRRKQVNMQYVPTRMDSETVIQRQSITASLQEISHFLATESTTAITPLPITIANDLPCKEQDSIDSEW